VTAIVVFALMLRFADRVVVIHQGRVLTDGPPAAIKALVARGVR
jgi:ABC-type branched-subunit amino acid transport system ATPase component